MVAPRLKIYPQSGQIEDEAPAILVGVPREILEKATSGKVESSHDPSPVNEFVKKSLWPAESGRFSDLEKN